MLPVLKQGHRVPANRCTLSGIGLSSATLIDPPPRHVHGPTWRADAAQRQSTRATNMDPPRAARQLG
jgi:hypothetical protein